MKTPFAESDHRADLVFATHMAYRKLGAPVAHKFSFDTTIELDEVEVEVTVDATYTPGKPDRMWTRHGDPGEQGYAAEAEILNVFGPHGLIPDKSIPEAVMEELYQTALMQGGESMADEKQDYQLRKYEDRIDALNERGLDAHDL